MNKELFATLDDLIFAYDHGIIDYETYLNERNRLEQKGDDEDD